MLHRVSRLHLSTLFSSTIRQGISSVPQVVPEKTLKNKVPEALSAEQFNNLTINFDQQEEGKINVIVAPLDFKNGMKIPQIFAGIFAYGVGYSIIQSFTYFATAVFAVGAFASLWKLHQLKSTRGYNRILSVQIDKDKRIHIDYMSGQRFYQFHNIIVDKKDFLYNAQGPVFNEKDLWIKANNQFFVLQKEGLNINSTQLHHLL